MTKLIIQAKNLVQVYVFEDALHVVIRILRPNGVQVPVDRGDVIGVTESKLVD